MRARNSAAAADLRRIDEALAQLPRRAAGADRSTTAPPRSDDRARRQQTEARLLARWGESKIGPSRHRIDKLMDLLGDPQRTYRSIHLTGTNGKTSTARMIDELLRGFGLRTGRYTSPHLCELTERIVVDGAPVSDGTFVEGYREIEPYLELMDKQLRHHRCPSSRSSPRSRSRSSPTRRWR